MIDNTNSSACEPLVRVENVRFAFGNRTILDGVTVDLRAGEFWCILGTNGVGKTTFVRLVLGLLSPSGGAVSLDPHLGRAALGFVPQRCDWNRNMPTTVREFVRLGLVGLSVSRADSAARLSEALASVGLAGMESRDFWSLSDGLRQRAVIARALVRRPRLLFLDEPTNALDPATEEGLMKLLDHLNRDEGLTLVVVTHDVELAERHASHVALFHSGRVTVGKRAEVLNQANLRRVYGTDLEVHSIGGHR